MAFPASSGTRLELGDTLSRIRHQASSIKAIAQGLSTAAAAGPIFARRPVTVMETLSEIRAQLETLSAAPGLAAYARTALNDQTLDIVSEYQTMRAALDACISWISTNIPKDAASGRWILAEEIVDGLRVDRTLSVAQTAGLRTALNALAATID